MSILDDIFDPKYDNWCFIYSDLILTKEQEKKIRTEDYLAWKESCEATGINIAEIQYLSD